MTVGVALAAWVVLRWYGRGRLAWLLPVVALVLVTYQHTANNLVAGSIGGPTVLRGYAGLRYVRTANAVSYAAADQREPVGASALTPDLMSWGRLAGLLR